MNSGMAWIPPCWIQLGLYLKPASEAAKEEFLFPLNVCYRLDAFSKISPEKQFESKFMDFLDHIETDTWLLALNKWYPILKEQLRHPNTMFQQPFHFVSRDKFVTVDLPTVLREDPERMEVYLAEEERTYTSYNFLRIHSSLWHFFPETQHLWFEKRLRSDLEAEDVLLWFKETIRLLPKKFRPPSLDTWKERFLRSQPEFSPVPSGENIPWASKPKVILVFGAAHRVGYRTPFHLERSKIRGLARSREILTIVAQIQWGHRANQAHDWTFHLITADKASAHRVEQEIIRGEKTHFGLDMNVIGMTAQTAGTVHSINVPIEKVRELCLKNGESLENALNPRNKHKVYYVVSKSDSSAA